MQTLAERHPDSFTNVPGAPSAPDRTEPRVCIVGPHASMLFGGEASFPWFYFKYLRARGVDAHLVVHARTEKEVRDAFPADAGRIHTVPDTSVDRFIFRLGKFVPGKIDVFTFGVVRHWLVQLRQKKVVRRLVREGKVNVVHETTPIAPKQISAMYALGAPVVMGPLSGGMTYPPAFRYLESRLTRGVEVAGRAVSHVLNLLVPGKVRAEGLIVANRLSRDCLPFGTRGQVYDMPEVGVDLSVWGAGDRPPRADDKVRFVYLGRLADWKGVNFLLDAFALVAAKIDTVRLEIIGDGEKRSELEAQAKRLAIAGKVTFHGYLLPRQGAALMRSADVLVLPSLHECGGVVVLEAMALGLPVVAANWAGPAVHVTDETGIRVNPDSRDGFVRGLADAMTKLAGSEELRAQMGAAGRRHVATGHYDWDRKIDRLLEIYVEVIDRYATKSRRGGGKRR